MWDRIVEMVAIEFEVAPEQITENSHMKEELGADSVDIGMLLLKLEDEFDVEISIEDFEKIETVGEVRKLLKQKLIE